MGNGAFHQLGRESAGWPEEGVHEGYAFWGLWPEQIVADKIQYAHA